MELSRTFIYSLILSGTLLLCSCSFLRITQSKNIQYDTEKKLALDIYRPKKGKDLKKVFVFIHGGNWNSGSKNQYAFLGKRMAKKGIVTVIIDYRLSPLTNYEGMATDAARALKWTREQIHAYGGDSSQIYVSGHSAGGHLAALIATDPRFFATLGIANPIKGVVLDDAFGLDIHKYLNISKKPKDSIYLPVFSKNQENWKLGSPINYLHAEMPRFMLFVGEKTHPSIIYGSDDFLTALQKYQPSARLVKFNHKKHVAMVLMFANPFSKAYSEIFKFMEGK